LLQHMTHFENNRKAAIGHRRIWGGVEPFGLRDGDRRQHVYVLGQTGTGKSTLLKNLLIQDIQAGRGCALLDPHGDMAAEILDFVPPSRTDHVVYFDPGDLEYPIAYNILAGAQPDEIPLLASGIVGAFKSIWASSWGPRLEMLLFASISALAQCCLATGNVTLLGVPRMLTDERYREWVLTHVLDVAVHAFWTQEFVHYDARFVSEMVSPVLNKVGQLLMSPALRNCLGQTRKTFDIRFMMDDGRILIANLSKGRIGEDKANLLGALLVSQFEQAALSRAGTPEEDRRDHFLFIDEFQNYVTDSFAGIMAESRKYKLALTLSNQHTAQLLPEVRDAILGNVGTMVAFRLSERDATVFSNEFGRFYSAEQFVDLANFEVLVKLLDQGSYGNPFRGVTLPPGGRFYGRRDNLIARSRQRFATRRNVVEEKIRRWMKGERS
jgi:type IV secretory pathway TraG/TraD family ATPase VirD4